MKIKKVKLTFLIFAGLVISSFALFTYAQNNSSSNKNIFLDSDQDGLSDSEEKTYGTDPNNADTDGDGYSDGVEIKSGYDPLKPAPGDKIVVESEIPKTAEVAGTSTQKPSTNDKNLSQELSSGIANLITENSSQNKQITVEDINKLLDKISEETITFDDLPEIDEKTIKTKEQNYSKLSEDDRKAKEKEDSLEYLTAVSYIIVNNSPQKISDPGKDFSKLFEEVITQASALSASLANVSYFESLAEKGQSILDQLNEIEVPENMVDLHIKGLKLAKYGVSLKDKVNTNLEEDPISTIVQLSKVQSFVQLGISFSDEVNTKLSDLGIDLGTADLPLSL